jgi:hypothetical protein
MYEGESTLPFEEDLIMGLNIRVSKVTELLKMQALDRKCKHRRKHLSEDASIQIFWNAGCPIFFAPFAQGVGTREPQSDHCTPLNASCVPAAHL